MNYQLTGDNKMSNEPRGIRGFIRNAVQYDPALVVKPALAKAVMIAVLMIMWPFPEMVRRAARSVHVQSLGRHMRETPR